MKTKLMKYAFLFVLALFITACENNNQIQAPPRTIIVLKDMSLSTPVLEDSLTNVFITTLMKQLRPGDELYVLAINEASFAKPLMLVHGKIPQDNHPLKSKSLSARERLAKQWRQQSQILKLNAKQTDIIGALNYCALLFTDDEAEKLIILLSDMRQSSAVLNLERKSAVDAKRNVEFLKKKGLIPDLKDVKAVVLGAHTVGRTVDPVYYKKLHLFWDAFFTEAGAKMTVYRTDRNWKLT
ncbi:MAG: hypothetical protein H6696_14455 [Deferribacteres bacterium]|nr:hypothetical protein [candidate division KSB1 bacterium]MCB9503129.1 hypothetical protein [Deferribacteres bacterium]